MQVASLVISTILFGEKKVKSEVNARKGWCDIIIYPDNINNVGIIIEVKSSKNALSEKQLEAKAISALKQIKNKDYIEEFLGYKPQKIYAYGFAYSQKKLRVKSEDITNC